MHEYVLMTDRINFM